MIRTGRRVSALPCPSRLQEKFAILRARFAAMETISVRERVELATEVMDAARASLAAKVALMGSMQ
jgi:hypothetical protein